VIRRVLHSVIVCTRRDSNRSANCAIRYSALLFPIAKTVEKLIIPYITANIPATQHQHGFKTSHSTTTAFHQLTNQITQCFNKKQPPDRTIVVSLDLSKAFDTVNIHNLISKIHQTTLPPPLPPHHHQIHCKLHQRTQGLHPIPKHHVQKTTIQNQSPSRRRPIAHPFNLYTSDLPQPPQGTTYADDMNPAASHQNYHVAEHTLQPQLDDVFNWIENNELMLNPDNPQSLSSPYTPTNTVSHKTLK
jgi:hypothetical protein